MQDAQGPSAGPAAAGKPRRQYAVNQTAAYGYDEQAAMAQGATPYGQQPYSQQQQGQQEGQFFSPAFGDPNQQVQPQQYGQPGVIGPGAPVHARQPSYPQQQYQQGQAPMYGQQPQQQQMYGQQQPGPGGMQGLTNQFSQMGVQQRMVQTTNLVGYNLDPRGLDEPPPDIRLPPNVRWIST